MSKGGEQVTKVEVPEEIKKAGRENQEFAKQVGALPYTPNFGNQFAAFTPTQNAAFQNTSGAANAFGMANAGGQTGLPPPTNVGGFNGYSTESLYNDAMSKVDPKLMELIKSFFYQNGQAPAGVGMPGAGSPTGGVQNTGEPFTFKGEQYNMPATNGRAFK